MNTKTLALVALLASSSAFAWSSGPAIYAPDGTYLGRLNNNPMDRESVSNPVGRYGSPFSRYSINNQFSPYGSQFSRQSPNFSGFPGGFQSGGHVPWPAAFPPIGYQ